MRRITKSLLLSSHERTRRREQAVSVGKEASVAGKEGASIHGVRNAGRCPVEIKSLPIDEVKYQAKL